MRLMVCPALGCSSRGEVIVQETRVVQPNGVALLGLVWGFEEGGAVRIVAKHG